MTDEIEYDIKGDVSSDDPRPVLWILGAGREAKAIMTIFRSELDLYYGFHFVDPIGDAGTGISFEEYQDVRKSCDYFLTAVGDNEVRKRTFEEAVDFGLRGICLNKGSFYGSHVEISTIIHPGACIGAFSVISKGVIVNNEATICHDTLIKPFSHIAPNATICGNVTIGEGTTVGASAVVPQNTSVPPETFIKANSVYSD